MATKPRHQCGGLSRHSVPPPHHVLVRTALHEFVSVDRWGVSGLRLQHH
jgi:hypothetical protein